jgi:hypothetical protein
MIKQREATNRTATPDPEQLTGELQRLLER